MPGILPGAICTAHALAGPQSHPELCFRGTCSMGRMKIDPERTAHEKPQPGGEGMCPSSAPEPQDTLDEKHWITSIGPSALDPKLALNHPSSGVMDLFPIPYSLFPIPHSLFPIPYIPWGWDQTSLSCQDMVPTALKLFSVCRKISWQHGNGLCL